VCDCELSINSSPATALTVDSRTQILIKTKINFCLFKGRIVILLHAKNLDKFRLITSLFNALGKMKWLVLIFEIKN